jgi:voltage-gated potassium channel
VTITTVGYGDFTPITITGRLIAGALMLGGVALLGIVTATLAGCCLISGNRGVSVGTRGQLIRMGALGGRNPFTVDRSRRMDLQ